MTLNEWIEVLESRPQEAITGQLRDALVSDIKEASNALSCARERVRHSRQEANRLGLLIDHWEMKYHDLAKANTGGDAHGNR